MKSPTTIKERLEQLEQLEQAQLETRGMLFSIENSLVGPSPASPNEEQKFPGNILDHLDMLNYKSAEIRSMASRIKYMIDKD